MKQCLSLRLGYIVYRHLMQERTCAGGTAPINGSSPFGGSGGGVVYWHSGPPRPPQHGQTFPLGYNKGVYNQGHRPPFYGQLVPGPPFAVPPFIPAMYPSGSLPR